MERWLLSLSQTRSSSVRSTQQSFQTFRPQSFQGERDKDLQRSKTRLIYWNCQKPPFLDAILSRKKKNLLKELTPR